MELQNFQTDITDIKRNVDFRKQSPLLMRGINFDVDVFCSPQINSKLSTSVWSINSEGFDDLLKNILLSEGELSEWAKTELVKSRQEKEEDCFSLEDL